MSLTADILTLRTIHLELWTYWSNLSNDITAAAGQCDAQNWAGLAQAFRNMYEHTIEIRNKYMGATPSMRNITYDILHYIDDNLNGGAPYELTMDKMLTAIWDSDKLRWYHFINYIDAMRGGIWNTEIYETHLADWYRHFSI